MPLLFAYGSLMNPRQFKKVVGRWNYARKAILRGYRLVFSGQGSADILCTSDADQVYGVVYEITPRQLDLVDNYEGVPEAFYRREQVTIALPSREHVANVFVKAKKEAFKRPPSRYLKQLIEGLRFHGYSEQIVNEVNRISQQEQL